MDAQVETALIAAGVSIVVCITTILVQSALAKKAAQHDRSLEVLKNKFDKRHETQQISDAALQRSIESLAGTLRAIQSVRDALLVIVDSVGDQLDAQEAIARSLRARDTLVAAYGDHHPELTDAEREACHRAKGIAIDIDQVVFRALHARTFASDITPPDAALLRSARARLGELHHDLNEHRIERLFKRLRA